MTVLFRTQCNFNDRLETVHVQFVTHRQLCLVNHLPPNNYVPTPTVVLATQRMSFLVNTKYSSCDLCTCRNLIIELDCLFLQDVAYSRTRVPRRNKPSSFDFKILSPFFNVPSFSVSNSSDNYDGTGVEGNAKRHRKKKESS